MDWIKYDVYTTTKDSDAIGDILLECGISGYEIKDHVPLSREDERRMYTDIPADRGVDDGTAVLTFYTEAGEEQEFYSTGSSLRDQELPAAGRREPEELIRQILSKIKVYGIEDLPEITFEVQSDSLWKDKWKENFKPFRVADDIIVKPSWVQEVPEAGEGDIILEIDPGSAFGTGTHETTRLCLDSLRKYIQPDTRLLDAGCGSGILAIAALLCGARSACCLDIDRAAVAAALENAANNGIDDSRMTAFEANILENSGEILKKCGTFPVVVANILADVIVKLAEYIGDFLEEDGVFISSGILKEHGDEVEDALRRNGFTIAERNEMGEWVSFVARKGKDEYSSRERSV